MKHFYSFCTVKTGTKLQKKQLLLLVSFSVSGPSDNSVHGKNGMSCEFTFMSYGIPGFSANNRLFDEQALFDMNELALPFYRISWSNQEPADINHIYNNGIGAGASADKLTHFN